MKPSDNADLRRTLSLIDYERCLRMRELETKRRQFLHQRSNALPCNTEAVRSANQHKEGIKKRIQMGKDAEIRHQAALIERKVELMDQLKARAVSLKVKAKPRNSLMFDDVSSKGSEKNSTQSSLPEYTMNNRSQVASLYQRSFDLLKRKKEAIKNPFVASVNTILQKLRAQEENADDEDGDPFSVLSKNIMKKYVDEETDMGQEGDVENENENIDAPLTSNTVPGQDKINESNIVPRSQTDDTDSIDKLAENNELDKSKDSMGQQSHIEKKTLHRQHSSALDLWAKVKKEQAATRRLTRQQQEQTKLTQATSIKTTSGENRTKTQHTLPTIVTIDTNATRSPENDSSSRSPRKNSTDNTATKALDSPRKASERNSPMSPQALLTNDGNAFQNKMKPISLRVPTSTSPVRNSHSTGASTKKRKIQRLMRDSRAKSLTDECIEECDETNMGTPNTVVVIHDDVNDDEMTSPIQWDRGYRYSFSQRDNEIINDSSFFKTLRGNDQSDDEENDTSSENSARSERSTEEKGSILKKADEQSDILGMMDFNKMSQDDVPVENEEKYLSQRILDSAMSQNTLSEIPSDGRTSTMSRHVGSGRRRLSMQTRGSLRALSGVMKEESRRQIKLQNENVHPESDTYKAIFDALAGAAAAADEQTQRLESVRRAGMGLKPAEKELKVTQKEFFANAKERNDKVAYLSKRRNTIPAPGDSSMADVTDPVYKFLKRRTYSKTMRRHKTLSNIELKLLAHAPGEDTTGRRHSFSSHQYSQSQQSSRRNSTSFLDSNGENLRRMSVSSSPRKASSDLSAVLENASVQSQKDSARSRIGSASTRPPSVTPSLNDGSLLKILPRETRSYSWAPDVSETKEWHVLAMELLARRNNGVSNFRTVSHMLQCLGDEYRRETASMMYEELRYCSYLRLPKHQQPAELIDSTTDTVFASGYSSPK